MAELKIYLSKDLNEKFRRIAMSVFGYGRGSISRAAEEALTKWCAGHDSPSGNSTQSGRPARKVVQSDRIESGINPDERVSGSAHTKDDRTDDAPDSPRSG